LKNNKREHKTRFLAGFTLIELLIVVAIVGILAGVGIPMYNGYIKNTTESTGKNNLRAIALMESNYNADNGTYLTGNNVKNTALINKNLFDKTILDPDSDYIYSVVDHDSGFQVVATPKSGVILTKYCLSENNDMDDGSDCP